MRPACRRPRSTARRRDELADLGQRLSALLECAATGEVPSERIRREIGVEGCRPPPHSRRGELPPLEMQELEQLAGSYTHLRASGGSMLRLRAWRR